MKDILTSPQFPFRWNLPNPAYPRNLSSSAIFHSLSSVASAKEDPFSIFHSSQRDLLELSIDSLDLGEDVFNGIEFLRHVELFFLRGQGEKEKIPPLLPIA